MTITVFAISTTGLPIFKRPASDPGQPRLVAIAATLYSSKWEEKAGFSFILKSDTGVSSRDAQAIHGITERERELYGVEVKLAMASLMRFVRHSKEIGALNMPFVQFMIDIELQRLAADTTDWLRGGLKRTCILAEAGAKHNFGRIMTIEGAHEAATGLRYAQPERAKHVYDVRAAARIMQQLRRST